MHQVFNFKKMKRIILSLLVTACLTACSKNDNDAPDDKKPPVILEPKPAPEPTVGVYPRIVTTTQHLRKKQLVAESTIVNGKVTKSIQKVTDLENGNVTTYIIDYKYDANGYPTEITTSRKGRTILDEKETYRFENKRLVEKIKIVEGGVRTNTHNYSYDSEGKLIKYIYSSLQYTDSKPSVIETNYTYSGTTVWAVVGNRTETITFDSRWNKLKSEQKFTRTADIWEYQYNDKPNQAYGHLGDLLYPEEFISKNCLTLMRHISKEEGKEDSISEYRREYQYNAQGNIREIKKYDSNGKLEETTEYEY
mgnify:FL=1